MRQPRVSHPTTPARQPPMSPHPMSTAAPDDWGMRLPASHAQRRIDAGGKPGAATPKAGWAANRAPTISLGLQASRVDHGAGEIGGAIGGPGGGKPGPACTAQRVDDHGRMRWGLGQREVGRGGGVYRLREGAE